MKSNNLLIALFLAGLSIIALWLWQTKSLVVAPHVTFTTITGKKIELVKLQSKPVIVTFWATDCAACIKEIPLLIELYQQFHPQGLEMIAVSMYYDLPNHVVAMSKARQLPYHVALDLKAEHANAFGRIKLTPTTFLISPDGNIIMQKTGLIDISDMKLRIENLLKG
jgi:peroxiredoxin